jgi:hypothetical protein
MFLLTYSCEVKGCAFYFVGGILERVEDGALFRVDATGFVGHFPVQSFLREIAPPLAFEMAGRGIKTFADDFTVTYDDTAAASPYTSRFSCDCGGHSNEFLSVFFFLIFKMSHNVGTLLSVEK